MTELSPAAQAVIDTWWNASDGEYINGVWTPNRSAQLAAVLRAVADQPCKVPPWYRGDDYRIYRDGADAERNRLLSIAAELEAQ